MTQSKQGRVRPDVLRAAIARQGHKTVTAFCVANDIAYSSVTGAMQGKERGRMWCLALAQRAGVPADDLFEWVAP